MRPNGITDAALRRIAQEWEWQLPGPSYWGDDPNDQLDSYLAIIHNVLIDIGSIADSMEEGRERTALNALVGRLNSAVQKYLSLEN